MTDNLYWHESRIDRKKREILNDHKSFVIWFTGLSGAGKSTIANALEEKLHEKGIHTYLLDGDNIRKGLNSDLGFSPEARRENIRRIAEVSKLFVDSGIVVLTAFISPYKSDRNFARKLFDEGDFIEVHVDCDIKTCIQRDTKGLYKKAMAGMIDDFTGISAPYEIPEKPEIIVNTDLNTVEENIAVIADRIAEKISF